MSLINEALKRAKEAQQRDPHGGRDARNPLGRGLELRPAEPAMGAGANRSLFLPIMLTLVALAGLFLLREVRSQNATSDMIAAAAGEPVALPATAAKPAAPASPDRAAPTGDMMRPRPVADAQRTAEAAARGSASPTAAPSATASATDSPNTSPVVAAAGATRTAGTNATQGLEPAAPPPALKLQAIVFSSSRPWAMINGKTVYAGDRFGDLRVLAIGRDSATLAGPAGTNVLALPE